MNDAHTSFNDPGFARAQLAAVTFVSATNRMNGLISL